MEKTKNKEKTNLNNLNNQNLNNLNNLNNLTNINILNSTFLLGFPENKTEAVFFHIYDNGETTGEDLVKIAGLSTLSSFYVLRNRNKEKIITKRKEGTLTYYDISQELREQISIRIQKKIDAKKRELSDLEEKNSQRKSKEEILDEIRSILSDKSVICLEDGFIWLDLKELQEINPKLFDLLHCSPDETKILFESELKNKGFDQKLRFRNFSECFKPKTIEGTRVVDLDKICLIECSVSSLSDVRPQITGIKFECPSCGTLISVLQIEKKIKEPSRCTCGRRGGFKEISRDLVDRARVTFEDIIDLTESPQTQSVDGFLLEYLTTSKELVKVSPGSEVRVLAIPKACEMEMNGKKTTALEKFLSVLEIEPFEKNIDLNSFTEQEIEQYKEMSGKIDSTNSLKEIEESFSPEIEGNSYPKKALILKTAQSHGRKNKSNILFIGSPGTSKSVLLKQYHALMPGSTYISGAGSSAVGLTATVEKKEEGWILKPGAMPKTKEDLIADEFNLIGEEETPKLQEAMSEGQITINKASIHSKIKTRCGIVAGANPIGGVFNEYDNLVRQFNIPIPILNRFDAIFVIKDSNDPEIDKKIASKMLKRENSKIKRKYDLDVLKRFFLYVRSQKEPSFPVELEESYIPQKYSSIRTLNRTNGKKNLINPRFIEAIIRFSKSMAKLKQKKEVSKSDVDFAINLLKNTYLNWGDGIV